MLAGAAAALPGNAETPCCFANPHSSLRRARGCSVTGVINRMRLSFARPVALFRQPRWDRFNNWERCAAHAIGCAMGIPAMEILSPPRSARICVERAATVSSPTIRSLRTCEGRAIGIACSRRRSKSKRLVSRCWCPCDGTPQRRARTGPNPATSFVRDRVPIRSGEWHHAVHVSLR